MIIIVNNCRDNYINEPIRLFAMKARVTITSLNQNKRCDNSIETSYQYGNYVSKQVAVPIMLDQTKLTVIVKR